MKVTRLLPVLLLLILCFNLSAQGNVGIGTGTPTEKLEVSGIIYANEGGIRFPDQTLQETAAFNTKGPGDAGMPYGQVYMTVKSNNPVITDTMRIVDISEGGATRSTGPAQFVPYVLIKEMDAATPFLFQKLVQVTEFTEARLHFLDSQGDLHKTIELRNAYVAGIKHLNIHRKGDEFAHLEQLTLVMIQLEIKHFFPNGTTSCFCWDFVNNTSCTCN